MISSVDITSFMNWFSTQFISMCSFVFNTLDSIHLWGFSLLQFFITLSIITAMLTVLFTFAPSTADMIVSNDKPKKDKENVNIFIVKDVKKL